VDRSGQMTRRSIRILLALAGVAFIAAFFRAASLTNPTTIALSFLLLVLGVAAWWSLAEAIAASFAAALCLNYFFLPPVGTFNIADPENWVAFFAFLAVSIVASQLSERARRKAREAIERQEETERLYTLSRRILMLAGSPAQVAGEVPRLIQQVFGAAGVVLYHRETDRVLHAGQEGPLSKDQLKEILLQGNVVEDREQKFIALPVGLGGKPIGSLVIQGPTLSDGARQAVTNLIALALESAHSREVASRAETVRQSEEFKATLLDALAHELKTPLTSAKAAVSAMLSEPGLLSTSHRELLTIVDEETQRLNLLITEVLQMARIEAGKLRLNPQACAVNVLLRDAIEGASRILENRKVEIHLAPDLSPVLVDSDLVGTVLRHLLENAAKYSPPVASIAIAAKQERDGVCISVTDRGSGLKEDELSRVFEKYYRSPATRDTVPGLGMGLAIARNIILAHGGRIWAESSPGQGSRFSFTLPSVRQAVNV